MMMMSGLKQVLIFGVGFVLALGLNHFNTKNTNLTCSYLPPQQQSHINTINNTTNQRRADDDEPINAAISARPVGFDYFLFVLQWPGAFCNLQRNRPRTCNPNHPLPQHQDKFTVHGLWPQLNNGESAIFCTTTAPMTPNDLAAVQNDLLDYWPNLFNARQWPPPATNNFWIKQWEKHGKCSSGMYNAGQYLDITIDLAKLYAQPILDELHSQGIDPDGITPHKASRIQEAVRRVTNHEPMISIQVNDSDEQLLLEIRLCIRRDGVTPFDCDPFYRFARP